MVSRSAGRPRRRKKIRGLAAGLTGLAAAVSLIVSLRSSTRDADEPEMWVATWNVCGVRQWNCESTGSPQEKRERIEALATASGIRILLLQEVCSGDLSAVRAALGSTWHTEFRGYESVDGQGVHSGVPCPGTSRGEAGYAILSASPLTEVSVTALPQPAMGLHRGILCATAENKDIRVCNAHLNPQLGGRPPREKELRDDQLKTLVRAASGPRTVFGGDLNTRPPGAANPDAWVWPSGPYTAYRECDQSRSSGVPRDTHESGYKIDYLFTALPRSGCTVIRSGASDHWALAMRIRIGRPMDGPARGVLPGAAQ